LCRGDLLTKVKQAADLLTFASREIVKHLGEYGLEASVRINRAVSSFAFETRLV
jgi:hypothetical protein